MPDIRILLVCILCLAVGSILCAAIVNSTPADTLHNQKNTLLYTINQSWDLKNSTSDEIGLSSINGGWDLKNGKIIPTWFDAFNGRYSICEFGKKIEVNNQISECLHITGVNYNYTDSFGICFFKLGYDKSLISVKELGIDILPAHTNVVECYLQFEYGTKSHDLDISGASLPLWIVTKFVDDNNLVVKYTAPIPALPTGIHDFYIGYTYYADNMTLDVYVKPDNPAYNGIHYVNTVDIVQMAKDYNIQAYYGGDMNRPVFTYNNINQLFNWTYGINANGKTRVGTNIPTFAVDDYRSNTISITNDQISILSTKVLNTNPLTFGNSLIDVLTWNLPPNPYNPNEPLLPAWALFFAVDVWIIGILAWIVVLLAEIIKI